MTAGDRGHLVSSLEARWSGPRVVNPLGSSGSTVASVATATRGYDARAKKTGRGPTGKRPACSIHRKTVPHCRGGSLGFVASGPLTADQRRHCSRDAITMRASIGERKGAVEKRAVLRPRLWRVADHVDPSWSAKADHPRFFGELTKTRGSSAPRTARAVRFKQGAPTMTFW